MDSIDVSRALVPFMGREREIERDFWGKIRRTAGKVPFADRAVAAYYAAVDPATPRHVKVILLAALAYFCVPTDLVPDFIAGLGFTDDATVLLTVLQTFSPHITESHRQRAERFFTDGPDAAAGDHGTGAPAR